MENHNTVGGLEDRVRNMILGNAERSGTPPSHLAGSSMSSGWRPPHDARDGTSSTQQGHGPEQQGQDASSADPSFPPALHKGGRKRPNQAQRRQMSAQLSIPIDTRPQLPHSARGYASPPGFQNHNYHQQSYGGAGRGQRPHSATFRLPSQSNAEHPHSGAALLSPHPRHQPSLSYQGPMPSHGEWQPRQPNGDPRSSHGPPAAFDSSYPRTARHNPSGSHGSNRLYHTRPDELRAQAELLEGLCMTIIAGAEIEPADIMEKEMFRAMIEDVARTAITKHEQEVNDFHNFPPASVQLKCFGSLSSGFATKAADMDLGLLSPLSVVAPDAPGSPIPRILEKAFLDIGLGARLLTRTRVPIIKVCQKPPGKLLEDLLAERAKWEEGLPDEFGEEDVHEEGESHEAIDIHPRDYRHPKQKDAETMGNFSPVGRFHSLRQNEKQSLSSYYGMAKGLFRKLGGRDYTHSNASELKEDDLLFLNEFALAFIDGLADSGLRERLLRYKSLNRYDLTANSKYRTFSGVYTQIEGEVMTMIWEKSREIAEKDQVAEQQGLSCVKSWKILGNKATFHIDPIGYGKELQHAHELLKRVPSIQIMSLSQNQHESAASYLSRTVKTMLELGIYDVPGPQNTGLHLVMRQYIKGIQMEQVRLEVQQFADACPKGTLSLRAVARRHSSLQLAHELERCIEKGLYLEDTNASIAAYIEILRAPMARSSSGDPHFDLVVPLPPGADSLVADIRRLGDPAHLAPNQPRDPYKDRLEFPKSGVGVQCDVNFSAHLALQNTLLLRCYSHTDPRVRPLVLFIKHWAKVRQINTPYRGTLSSYGYVLMMLHYLVNIAQPFVCPNLQLLAQPPDSHLSPKQIEETVTCKGRNVQFWRDEATIQRLARDNALNQNQDSLGHLLRGFFEYYAQSNQMSTVSTRGFDWGRDVLSLRTPGGLLSKAEKGWTGAKTVYEVKETIAAPPTHPGQIPAPAPNQAAASVSHHGRVPSGTNREVKEVRNRYLFAIEDPFELDHNVARTVTHIGIVAIRDEFRRAWRIIREAGRGVQTEDLLQDVAAAENIREKEQFARLLEEIHGPGAL